MLNVLSLPNLKEFEDKALSAKSRALSREKMLYETLVRELGEDLINLQVSAAALSELDVLTNLAERAETLRFVQPQLVDESVLHIQQGRHPVVENLITDPFVANDTQLDQQQRMQIITGPNMGGKSTYMRQVAVITLLAYVGSYVPAEAVTLGPIDRIFTRMGSADDVAGGRSTFMVEMTETANILHNASENSLVLMDEVGRGTSTFDGLSLAWASAAHLADSINAFTLFATHYFEMTALPEQHDNACNVHLKATEHDDKIIFLHSVEQGPANQSYGLQVAQLAGVPTNVITQAKTQLQQLEQQAPTQVQPASQEPAASAQAAAEQPAQPQNQSQTDIQHQPQSQHQPQQGDMFSVMPSVVEEKLGTLDLDNMTPRQALESLYHLKELL